MKQPLRAIILGVPADQRLHLVVDNVDNGQGCNQPFRVYAGWRVSIQDCSLYQTCRNYFSIFLDSGRKSRETTAFPSLPRDARQSQSKASFVKHSVFPYISALATEAEDWLVLQSLWLVRKVTEISQRACSLGVRWRRPALWIELGFSWCFLEYPQRKVHGTTTTLLNVHIELNKWSEHPLHPQTHSASLYCHYRNNYDEFQKHQLILLTL